MKRLHGYVIRGAMLGAGTALVAGFGLMLAGCPSQSSESSSAPAPAAQAAAFGGTVWGGRQPVSDSKVVAYAAATTVGAAPTVLGTATTDADGNWTMPDFSSPSDGQVVYVVATGGDALGGGGSSTNDAIKLMTIAGVWGSSIAPVDTNSNVNINELSTVAAAAALKDYIRFVDCSDLAGLEGFVTGECVSIPGAAGLPDMAATIGNLVNVKTGGASGFLAAQADGSSLHASLEKMDTLANVLAGCVNTQGNSANPSTACANLFDAELGNPSNTLAAAWLAAESPVINADGDSLFALQGSAQIYTPALTAAPADWTVGGDRFAYVASSGGTVAYRLGVADGTLVPISGVTCDGSLSINPDNCVGAYNQPFQAALDRSGRNLYVVNNNTTPTVISYAISASGMPVQTGVHSVGSSPRSVAVDPSSGRVYVANFGDSTLSICSPDLKSCSATPAAGTSPRAIAIASNSSGTHAYVVNYGSGSVSTYNVSDTDGSLTYVAAAPAGSGPQEMAIDPTGSYVYVGNYDGNSVSAYRILASGALSALGAAPAGSGPQALAVSLDGKYTYVANRNGGTVSSYRILASGALSAIGAIAAGSAPSSVTVDPSGGYVYVANFGTSSNSVSTYKILASGALTAVGAVAAGAGPFSLVADPTGRYIYTANFRGDDVSAWTIGSSGAPTPIATYTDAHATRSVAMDPLGRYLYVVNLNYGVSAYTIATDGTLSAVVASPYAAGTTPYSVAVDPMGRYVYVANNGSNTISAYQIVSATGALSAIGATPAGSAPYAVAVDPANSFVYTANGRTNNVSAYAVGGDGALSPVTTGGAGACFPGAPSTPPDPENCFSTGSGTQLPFSLAVDPSGSYLYAANYYGNSIVTFGIDAVTGALSPQTTLSLGYTPYGVAVDPTGSYAYVADCNGCAALGWVYAYRIDRTNHGALNLIARYDTGADSADAVAVDPTGHYVYVANDAGLGLAVFAIQPDGSLVPVPGSPFASVKSAVGIAVGP